MVSGLVAQRSTILVRKNGCDLVPLLKGKRNRQIIQYKQEMFVSDDLPNFIQNELTFH